MTAKYGITFAHVGVNSEWKVLQIIFWYCSSKLLMFKLLRNMRPFPF